MITVFVHLFVCFGNVIQFTYRTAANRTGNLLASDKNMGTFFGWKINKIWYFMYTNMLVVIHIKIYQLIKFCHLCDSHSISRRLWACIRFKRIAWYFLRFHAFKWEWNKANLLRHYAINLTVTLVVVDMRYNSWTNKRIKFQWTTINCVV